MKISWVTMVVAGSLVCGGCGDDGGNAGQADASVQEDARACAPAHTIFLNNQGGSYTMGAADNASTNVSQVIDMDRANMEGYAGADWPEVVQCIRDGLAPFNIEIVESDPGVAEHTEIVFTTSGWFDVGVGSISAFTCDSIPSAIVWVFPSPASDLCKDALSQWAAAAAGLEHAYDCRDYLTYLPECGPRTWVDEEVSCGEFDATNCQCSGGGQNSYQTLLSSFGANCE